MRYLRCLPLAITWCAVWETSTASHLRHGSERKGGRYGEDIGAIYISKDGARNLVEVDDFSKLSSLDYLYEVYFNDGTYEPDDKELQCLEENIRVSIPILEVNYLVENLGYDPTIDWGEANVGELDEEERARLYEQIKEEEAKEEERLKNEEEPEELDSNGDPNAATPQQEEKEEEVESGWNWGTAITSPPPPQPEDKEESHGTLAEIRPNAPTSDRPQIEKKKPPPLSQTKEKEESPGTLQEIRPNAPTSDRPQNDKENPPAPPHAQEKEESSGTFVKEEVTSRSQTRDRPQHEGKSTQGEPDKRVSHLNVEKHPPPQIPTGTTEHKKRMSRAERMKERMERWKREKMRKKMISYENGDGSSSNSDRQSRSSSSESKSKNKKSSKSSKSSKSGDKESGSSSDRQSRRGSRSSSGSRLMRRFLQKQPLTPAQIAKRNKRKKRNKRRRRTFRVKIPCSLCTPDDNDQGGGGLQGELTPDFHSSQEFKMFMQKELQKALFRDCPTTELYMRRGVFTYLGNITDADLDTTEWN